MENILYYTRPASTWEEALPLGNGTMGAMIYGGSDNEIIRLNHAELWSGEPYKKTEKSKKNKINEIRRLISEKNFYEATLLADTIGENDSARYLPMGDIFLTAFCENNPQTYKRSLDLKTATAEVYFQEPSQAESVRKAFISHPHNIMVVDITGNSPYPSKKLSYAVSTSTDLEADIQVHENTINVSGKALSPVIESTENPIHFNYTIYAQVSGGKTYVHNNKLIFESADRITLYIASETNFNGWNKLPDYKKNLEEICQKRIDFALASGLDAIYKTHIKDYSSLYDRLSLELSAESSKLPTDERIKRYDGTDNGLCELLFNYGRYLTISASRENSQAMNLQGIWNHKLKAPWRCNYTTNINTEMNYWCSESCNLSECHTPLFNMLEELCHAGKNTAEMYYDCRGFAVHHNTDLWRKTTPATGQSKWALWPMAGVWMCSHLWQHYEYTLDKEFLRKTAYPIMKEACSFLCDYLVKKGDYHITSPSTTPENVFVFKDKKCSVSEMTTMDIALTKELFRNYELVCSELNIENDTILGEIKEKNIPPFPVGSNRRLMEWSEEFEEAEKGHRHLSHLYGIFPGEVITENDSDLWNAAKNSLMFRLSNGSGHTGWSCGWIINLFAIYKEPEMVKKYVDTMLKNSTYPNLMDSHPPFQIDGNFGFTAGVANSLLQSRKENDTYIIEILPSIPKEWKKGSIKGLCAKGGFKVDIIWNNSEAEVRIVSEKGNNYKIKSAYNIIN